MPNKCDDDDDDIAGTVQLVGTSIDEVKYVSI